MSGDLEKNFVDGVHLDEVEEADPEDEGEADRGHDEPSGQEDEEGGVVTRELKFGLLAVQEVPINLKERGSNFTNMPIIKGLTLGYSFNGCLSSCSYITPASNAFDNLNDLFGL